MSFRPNEITRQHVLDAVAKINLGQISLIPSRKFDVIIENRPYPPKEVMRYAHEQLSGEKRWELSGGGPTNDILRALGFEVLSKADENDEIKQIIERYKRIISENQLSDELYKWRLLYKHRGKPNLDAPDLAGELKGIEYSNLLYPMSRAVMLHLAKDRTEEYREALGILFDESRSLSERIKGSQELVRTIYSSLVPDQPSHYDERTMSVILTFRDPDLYTFYKDSFYRRFCEVLGEKSQRAGEKYVHFLELVDDFISEYILEDSELLSKVDSFLTEDCFPDMNRRILAQDILYQTLERKDQPEPTKSSHRRYWIYAPGPGAEYWDEFLEKGIMAIGWDELGDLRRFGGREEMEAALTELDPSGRSKKVDSLAVYGFRDVMSEGDIVIPKRGRNEFLGYGVVTSDYDFDASRLSYKSVRKVDWKKNGSWKEEHPIVLKTLTDITDFKTTEPGYDSYVDRLSRLIGIEREPEDVPALPVVQLLNEPLNRILYGPPGTGKTYNSIDSAVRLADGFASDHNRNKKRFDELREEGRIEFVTFHQNYSYEDFMVGIRPDVDNEQLRFQPQKGIFYRIAKRARENYEASQAGKAVRRSFDEVLSEVLAPLERGEEIPVQMASGISFFITEVSEKSISFRKQSGGTAHTLSISTLRDVVDDVRDVPGGLDSYYRPFVKIIKEKRETSSPAEPRKNFALVIDEINRANISRVFGELITLLEEDKRLGGANELRVTLPNGEKDFVVPPNLFIVGTMNTADKSIALIDIALRRRFEFVGYYPSYEMLAAEKANLLRIINRNIFAKKKSADYLVGHAYFMGDASVEDILEKKVIPLLSEYFAGKTEMVVSVFEGTNWRVSYNTEYYSWEIELKDDAALV